jgi:MFS family permease
MIGRGLSPVDGGNVTAAPSTVSLWRLPGIRRLVAVTLLGFVGFAATLSALPWWALQGGATVSSAGLVTTAMLLATVCTQPAVPAIVRRTGNGRALALGLLLLGAPSPLYALTADLGPLLAISAVRGTGFALLTVVGSTMTWTLAPPGRHGESAGIYGLAVGLTSLAVVPGAVALAQNVAFWPVALLATLPVLAVPAALRMSRDELPRTAAGDVTVTAGGAPRHGRAVIAVLAPCLVLLVVTLAGSGIVTFLPIERATGLLAPLALLLFGGSSAVVRWWAGLLADRFGTRLLLPLATFVTSLGLAALAVGLVVGSDALVLVAAAVCGSGYGAVHNLTLVASFVRVEPEDTPTASAVWNLAFDGGTAIGAVAVGALAAGFATADVAASDGTGSGIPLALLVAAVLVLAVVPLGASRWARPALSRRPSGA